MPSKTFLTCRSFFCLGTAFCLLVSSSHGGPQVVSSRDLNGTPQVIDQGGAERVILDPASRSKLKLGQSEILTPGGLHTIRIPIASGSDIPLKLEIRTSFIKTDGSTVRNPYAEVKGGFEGMARGFVGLLSMGASEMVLEDRNEETSTIVTIHRLDPGQDIIVEHQLPFQCDQVVGSRSQVSVVRGMAEEAHEREVRKMLQERYWKVRQTYFSDRQAEQTRWEQVRQRLEAERNAYTPLSEGYKAALESYWKAHKSHAHSLEQLEANFSRFASEQKQLLQNELGFSK